MLSINGQNYIICEKYNERMVLKKYIYCPHTGKVCKSEGFYYSNGILTKWY